MKNKKSEVIVCPICGMEYLPCEIFLPNALLGKSNIIVKDDAGLLVDFDGEAMDTTERYICDKCGTSLKINAKVQFNVVEDKVANFDEDYTTSTHKESLQLTEDE